VAAAHFAGVELGGTKSIAVLARGDTIVERVALPTTADAAATLAAMRRQLDAWRRDTGFAALGIASFGPVAVTPGGSSFGHILATPKPGWSGAPVAPLLTDGLDCPWRIDTDVNGAALAEYRWGAGKGCDSLCYVTIGTGVGGGLLVDGRPLHGAMHPELGHLALRRAPGDTFTGACPFHGDCIEGLLCGPALAARFGTDPAQVPGTHPAWEHVASDLAALCGAVLLTASAERILFGGSVATARPFLLDQARRLVVARLGDYLPFLAGDAIDRIVQPAALGSEAGPLGAIALARDALAHA
jgi:fructokinase